MMARTFLLALSAALVFAPVVAGYAGTTPPGGDCAGIVDAACFHWDCNNVVCIRLFCPVYHRHGAHVDGGDFGCA